MNMRNFTLSIVTMFAMIFAGSLHMDLHAQQQQQQQMDRDQQLERVSGTVMQKEDDSFTLRTDDGQTMTFQTDEDVGQLTEEEREQREREREELHEQLDEVEEGQHITVHYREGMTPNQHVAVRIEVEAGERPGAAGAQQQEREYQTPQQQQQQMQEGEQSISGTIVQKEDDSFTIRADDGRTMNFRVEESAQLTGQMGQMERQQMERQHEELHERLEELSEGDRVTVHYRSGATPTEHIAVRIQEERPEMGQQEYQQDPQRQDWQEQQRQQPDQMGEEQTDSITGTITQKEDESFTLRAEDGRTMTFRVEDNEQLTDQQRQQQENLQRQLDQIEEGDRVTVHYRHGATPTEHIAVSVEHAPGTPGMNNDSPFQQVQDQQQQDPQQQQQQQQQDEFQQDELPATSGMLPLVAGMGLLTLVAGLGLGAVARRPNN
jgi:hypothetical protein